MGEVTAISWCDEAQSTGRKLGAHKSAAKKAGCSLDEWYARRARGQRRCYRCEAWKPKDVFSLDSTRQGGHAPICKPCNSARSTRSRYGLSEEDFSSLQAAGACPICERSGVPMEVDHNHRTGAVRAILCSRCNSALGMFCEDAELMRRAIAYLEEHDHG
ncbi:endonuclease domain-containing protein [Mesorhizobium sp. M0058]|uniref:endonuclease domain-containing protein n=1 Tax=Mesorhizobium sp. M0058 TaxID=2956865 RepID=UPI003338F827